MLQQRLASVFSVGKVAGMLVLQAEAGGYLVAQVDEEFREKLVIGGFGNCQVKSKILQADIAFVFLESRLQLLERSVDLLQLLFAAAFCGEPSALDFDGLAQFLHQGDILQWFGTGGGNLEGLGR
ncbi:hypothetical protein D9M69_599530 [compost metagenome]